MFTRDRGFIFSNVAHTTILKETSSLLRFHFQRRSLSCRSKLIQVSRWPSGLPQGLAVLSVFVVRPWRSERVEAVGFQSFLYEQRVRICFQSHQNTRAAQKIKLNGKCIRHSGVFVMKWSLIFCAAFVPPVRGDVTFVWESVTNHVIWIVYLINIHYVTIR